MRSGRLIFAFISVLLSCGIGPFGGKVSVASSKEVIGKKHITAEVFDRWRYIASAEFSQDGKWAVYVVRSERGGAELVAQATQNVTQWRVLMNRDSHHSPSSPTRTEGTAAYITVDSQFVIFMMSDESDGGTGLGILHLADGSRTMLKGVISFDLPKQSGRYLAYKTSDESLTIRELNSGKEVRIANVSEFTFDQQGKYLAYIVTSEVRDKNGVYVRQLEGGRVTSLAAGAGTYRGLAFNASSQRLAFLLESRAHADEGTGGGVTLLYCKTPLTKADVAVDASTLKKGMFISLTTGLEFKGDLILFHLNPAQRQPKPINSDNPYPDFDLWHWRDPVLQPTQKTGWIANSYLAAYSVGTGKWVQLETPSLSRVLLSQDGKQAVGIDPSPYLVQEGWGDFAADIYRLDVETASRTLLVRAFKTGQWVSNPHSVPPVTLSPSGRYLLYFQNRRWVSYDLYKGVHVDLSGKLLPEVRFDLEYSYTANRPARPLGIAGWIRDERCVLIYSLRDVWEFDPSGDTPPRNLTDNYGHVKNIVFRIWPHDLLVNFGRRPEEVANLVFQPDEPLLLNTFDVDTKASGIWRDQIGSQRLPQPLLILDKKITLRAYNRDTQQFLLTQETFGQFPDLWMGRRLDGLIRISDVNPQHQEYRWGTAELVKWSSRFGAPLQGVLFKPEGFDPSRQYPMIVSIYGLLSYALHEYRPPKLLSNGMTLSPAPFLSKDYLVFFPDIVNATPFPGETAVAAVLPGVQSLLDRGFVDSKRLALMGHSWGGYEVAYILTRTNVFRAAIESAGTTNTLSSYSGQGFMSKAYQYESGFALHGGSIWENPWVYLVNSPIMLADRVQTPLLMLHNDNDEAVPFVQAAELYFALRRNSREVYWFNYNDERHSLERYISRFDWDHRVHEFLDHFLLNAPKPEWMQHPVPHTRKGCDVRLPSGYPDPVC